MILKSHTDNENVNHAVRVFKFSARKAYKDLDNRISQLPKSCKKGCTYCCNQSINILMWEEPLIIDFVDSLSKQQKIIIKNNIKEYFKVFNEITPEANRDNPLCAEDFSKVEKLFREKRIPCPMLNNGLCMIYKVRPTVCRAHIVSGSPQECKNDPHLTADKKAYDLRNYILGSFNPEKMGLPEHLRGASKPLAYLLAGELDIDVKVKPLFQLTREYFNKQKSMEQ